MTRAVILALFLASPASAGGLATSPIPPDRPAYAPLMEPLPANRCQHIPWTLCADGEPESRDVPRPEAPTPADNPPAAQPDKPQPDKPGNPCKSNRKLGC